MDRSGKRCPYTLYIIYNIIYTDKMAEKKFTFGRKKIQKNLHISKKSSNFAPELENKIVLHTHDYI